MTFRNPLTSIDAGSITGFFPDVHSIPGLNPLWRDGHIVIPALAPLHVHVYVTGWLQLSGAISPLAGFTSQIGIPGAGIGALAPPNDGAHRFVTADAAGNVITVQVDIFGDLTLAAGTPTPGAVYPLDGFGYQYQN